MKSPWFDTHVHTTFSPDGVNSLEDYAHQVDEGVVRGIGFAEHDEFWPGSDGYGFLDVPSYLDAVSGRKDQGYPFFAGVEVDFMEEYRDEIVSQLTRFRFDYAIGSVHNLPSASVSGRDLAWSQDPEVFSRVLDEYHSQVAASLRVEAFAVVGHAGVYARHLGPEFWADGRWRHRIADLEDDLAQKVAASGKLLEVNTSGLFCARQAPCAGAFLVERFLLHGGRGLTLASDAHRAADLVRGFAEATIQLRTLGVDHVFLPWEPDRPTPLPEFPW